MNRNIALSALSVLTTFALIGGATFAFFSDVGTSTGNTFSAGTLDLKLTDDNESAVDNVSTTWVGSNLAPGGPGVTATLNFQNTGTVPGDHVHFKAANTLTDAASAETPVAVGNMMQALQITAMSYDGGDILLSLPDGNGNGIRDLDDLSMVAGDGMSLGSLSNLSANHALVMTVVLHSSVDNTYQGDSVGTVFTATLHQNASQ